VRDPHEIVVSQVHYMSRRNDHRSHDLFMSLPDTRSRLELAITGDASAHVTSIGERLDRFAGWLGAGLVVRFEDLIGPAGGGDRARQTAALREIFGFLGIPVTDGVIASIGSRLFSSDSPTFRRGATGGWREVFDPQTEALFDSVVGERAVAYGYRRAGEGRQ
jgi:hypothetical protein